MAKKQIENELLNDRVRQNKIAQRRIDNIVDTTRLMQSLEKEISLKNEEIQKLRIQGQNRFSARENDILNLGMIILQFRELQDQEVRIEEIFLGDNDPIIETRKRSLSDILSCLRFLYTQDPIDSLSEELLEVVLQNTPTWDAQAVRHQSEEEQ